MQYVARQQQQQQFNQQQQQQQQQHQQQQRLQQQQQQRPYRRDSRINSFMAFTHHYADAIADAVFSAGPKYQDAEDNVFSAGPKYHMLKEAPKCNPGPKSQVRRPKLPSTTDDSTDEIACLKAERRVSFL